MGIRARKGLQKFPFETVTNVSAVWWYRPPSRTANSKTGGRMIVRRPSRCATGHPSRTRALGLGALVVPAHPLWHAPAALLIERHAFPMRARRSIRNGSTAFRLSLQVAFGRPPGPYAYRGLRARASLSLARSVGGSRMASRKINGLAR